MRPAELFSLSAFTIAFIVGCLLGVIEFGVFIGLPVYLIVAVYVIWFTSNYFFEIVEHRALGNAEWPVFSLETLVSSRSQIGIGFAVFAFAVVGAYYLLGLAGLDVWAELLLFLSLAALPGVVALLAVTRSIVAALNPPRLAGAIAGLGHTYVVCLGAAAAVVGLVWLAQARGGFWYFPLVYGLFLFAYVIGSCAFVRRNVLGVQSSKSPEARAARLHDETLAVRKGVLSHAYGFAVHGNRAGALRYIDAYLAQEEDTLEARLWMLGETARWERPDTALEFGSRLIEYCEANGFDAEAARVRVQCEHLRDVARVGPQALF